MTYPPAALRLQLAVCAIALALVPLLAGCGEEGAPTPGTATARGPAPKAESRDRAASGCPKRLTAFVESLEDLRRRLAVGLAYEQYLAQVKRLRSSYAGIPVDRLTFDCLATGTPGERALNEHIDAANAWSECLADASCTTAAIEPVLQRRWRAASRFLSAAQ